VSNAWNGLHEDQDFLLTLWSFSASQHFEQTDLHSDDFQRAPDKLSDKLSDTNLTPRPIAPRNEILPQP